MIDIKKKSRINVKWKVSPYDYSKDGEKTIIAKFSQKYGIPKDKIKVTPKLQMIDDNGEEISMNTEVIQNIQDPQFQTKLFADYIKLNEINDYDFDLIKKIDSEINAKIDYKIYDKYRRYSIKWIRWDNFLSYGADNYFDFRNLGKLTLLSSEPANQGGKTTFCVDLIRFLLFGTTTKYKVQSKFFNKHLTSATNVTVEGCINIDGNDYIIKRTLTRPSEARRTANSKTTQKVEYYRIVGENKEELEEYIDNQQEENSIQTNKAIKEAIGRESDFELIMCVTGKSLDDLVDKKEAERGRLLARWIGLLPIEEKDALARVKFNSEIKPYLLSNRYNSETVKQEIKAFELVIDELNKTSNGLLKENKELEKDIKNLEKTKETLLSSKLKVDETIFKVDITTLNRKIEDCISEGKKKALELDKINKELSDFGNITFSVKEYDDLQDSLVKATYERTVLVEKYKNAKNNIEQLKKNEYCPTCGRKLDNVDNTKAIKELENDLEKLTKDGSVKKELIESISKQVEQLKESREKYTRKNELLMSKSALELNIEKLRGEYKDLFDLKKRHDENSEAIDKNNSIDVQIRNTDIVLRDKKDTFDTNVYTITKNEAEIKQHTKSIEDRNELLLKLTEETKLVKNWKIYLDMVGKDGISKMVLRKTLPIINARLSQLLNDICDFNVEVAIDSKNDVMFYLVKDGVYSDLSGASGFELTASALALRAVLGDMSTIPRNGILILDEVLGRVAKENYDKMKELIDRIGNSYDTIINITHLDEFKDYCDSHIVVRKENNISTISLK